MAYEIIGKLHKKFDTEQKTETFQAREFVIVTEDTYPQFIKFQLTQDRCQLIESYNEGDGIKVHFDLRGREWNEKYFTNLNAWRIENNSPSEDKPDAEKGFDPLPSENDEPRLVQEDFEDLPF